jgi:ketosteroid isomerase-like protein
VVDAKIAQIRPLETKFDEIFNKNDAATVARLYTENAFYGTSPGGFHGRKAIEKDYARLAFQDYHANNLFTTVDRVLAVGNEEDLDRLVHCPGCPSLVPCHGDSLWTISVF